MNEIEIKKKQQVVILDNLKAKVINQEEMIKELERKRTILVSQKEFIEKLNSSYEDIPDPISEGRFITETPPLDHHNGIIGMVKEVRDYQSPQSSFLFRGFLRKEEKKMYEIVCETKFIELDPEQLAGKIEELTVEIDEAIRIKEELVQQLQNQRNMLKALDEELQERVKDQSVLESQKFDIGAERNKLIGELDTLKQEIDDIIATLTADKKSEEEINYKLDTINQDLESAQNAIKETQDGIAAKADEREEMTVAVAQLETEIQSNQEKLLALNENRDMFTQQIDGWLEEIGKIEQDGEAQAVKRVQFQEEIQKLLANNEELKTRIEEVKESLNEFVTQKEDIVQRTNSIRESIAALEKEIQKIKGEYHKLEMNLQELNFKIQSLKDRIEQAYKVSLDEQKAALALENRIQDEPQDAIEVASQESVDAQEGGVPDIQVQPQDAEVSEDVVEELPQLNPQEAQAEIERLRKRCESFGNVNLVAIDEYEELKDRFEFLTQQQSDLLEAKSQLMSTITKINRSCRQMFMDTFTKVSEEFRIYFRMLFGGGEANLVLLDEENVLESGIDIIARPPGKKMQNITLMSGGEKTLTAIALIFGVFKVNPSPFCVLDEIDAALDESNVGRFAYLLKDFASIAQFIVITHNKKTMSNADVMYGITMPERGVSRIVSVNFKEMEKLKQQQAAVPA